MASMPRRIVLAALMIVPLLRPACLATTLQAHAVVIDARGHIIPWYSANLGLAYDHSFDLLWHYWIARPNEPANGQPHYMQHCTDPERAAPLAGLASDQLGTALASWKLLYAYNGNAAVLANAEYIANIAIDYGLSASTAHWPHLLYPCNTVAHPALQTGFYDGDMYLGKDVLMPHVSANFANELVDLYKITGKEKYLDAATNAANTLATMIRADADATYSPWPFRINAVTNAVPKGANGDDYGYTTHFVPMLELFTKLIDMNRGNTSDYTSARNATIAWLKKYPVKENHWGNYFEDDDNNMENNTETNADTLAKWVLENQALWGSSYLADASSMLNWTYAVLGMPMWNGIDWTAYGTVPICEETRELPPIAVPGYAGQSHTARHYAVKLLYCEKVGDWAWKDQAVCGLNWATYMVAANGTNWYPSSGNWYTDGYTDYIRHYLLAMGVCPDLAYDGADHLLRSSSVVKAVAYSQNAIDYTTYDNESREVLRITFTPQSITAGGVVLAKLDVTSALDSQQGYTFEAPGDAPGVLRIHHASSGSIHVHGK